jgi:hypothetical protein
LTFRIQKFCQTNDCYNISVVFDVGGVFDAEDSDYLSENYNILANYNANFPDFLNKNNNNNTNSNNANDNGEKDGENSLDSNTVISVENPRNTNASASTHAYHFECNIGYVLDLEPHEVGMSLVD